MARSLSKEATEEELGELQDYLRNDEELSQRYKMLKKLWNVRPADRIAFDKETAEKNNLRKILNRAEEERSAGSAEVSPGRKIIRFFFGKSMILLYAAAVILFLIIYHYEPAAPLPGKRDMVTAQSGSKTKMLLPDGTTVLLNGDSKLFYDKNFSGKRREVFLEGEAFFDVVKDSKRPFIVHAGNINIRVLGTAFNVRYYKDDENFETTLLKGKVQVTKTSDNDSPPILLKPNQKLIVPVKVVEMKRTLRNDYKVEKLDLQLKEDQRIETAWVYNRIQFRGDNFEELARKLERWYDIKIEFEDDSARRIRFNGSFEKETAEEAFSALQKVAPFKYKIYGREVFIKSSE